MKKVRRLACKASLWLIEFFELQKNQNRDEGVSKLCRPYGSWAEATVWLRPTRLFEAKNDLSLFDTCYGS